MRKTQADRQAEAARATEITEQALPLTIERLAGKIRCGLFADRDTLDEALQCAHEIMSGNPASLTALYIVLNTVSNELLKINAKGVK